MNFYWQFHDKNYDGIGIQTLHLPTSAFLLHFRILLAATHILRPTCHSVQLMDMDLYPFEAMFLANLGRGEIRRFDYWEILVS